MHRICNKEVRTVQWKTPTAQAAYQRELLGAPSGGLVVYRPQRLTGE